MAARRGCQVSHEINGLDCPTKPKPAIDIAGEKRISSNPKNHIPSDIKRAIRAVGYALWLDENDVWARLPLILAARLTVEQRAMLAFAALDALPDKVAWATAEDNLFLAQDRRPL